MKNISVNFDLPGPEISVDQWEKSMILPAAVGDQIRIKGMAGHDINVRWFFASHKPLKFHS